jgi:hypothetical protein
VLELPINESAIDIDSALEAWKDSLFPSIPLGGLYARNKVAHKWKATYRSFVLREAICWRLQDLMSQSWLLHQQGHGLGARILLRSALETLAMLIYLNQLMQGVLNRKLDFHVFSDKTTALLTGSRNDDAGPQAVNILTVLEKCDRRYPGIKSMYHDLSESAHPNWEGLCSGYSTVDHDQHETIFSNRWMELHGNRHPDLLVLCIQTFYDEYNDVWDSLFTRLENWIEENDDELEATKPIEKAASN